MISETMTGLFWISAALIVWVYAGYPALLLVWARLRPRPIKQVSPHHPAPDVSIVIAARNEGARLPKRIENLLALDYTGQRQIIVVSDGSTDNTLEALKPFSDRIQVVALPPCGKATALNAGVERARHDILVFADARQTFAADALLKLTMPLQDPAVGGVTGELVMGCEQGGRRSGQDRRDSAGTAQLEADRRYNERRGDLTSTVGDGVGLYWRYEKSMRRLESTIGSTLGATGAIYALRRSLWRPLPHGTVLDDVLAPMRAVLVGARVVFAPAAVAFDWTPPDSAREAGRKIRTLAGNIQILWLEPRLLVPFVNPLWVQYLSHKVGRLVVPYALMGLMAASLALAGTHLFYAVALVAQCLFYLLAGYGAWLELRQQLPAHEAAPMAASITESVADA